MIKHIVLTYEHWTMTAEILNTERSAGGHDFSPVPARPADRFVDIASYYKTQTK